MSKNKEFQLLGIEPTEINMERKFSLEEQEILTKSGTNMRNRRNKTKTIPEVASTVTELPTKCMKLSEVLADEGLYFIFKQFSMKEL